MKIYIVWDWGLRDCTSAISSIHLSKRGAEDERDALAAELAANKIGRDLEVLEFEVTE